MGKYTYTKKFFLRMDRIKDDKFPIYCRIIIERKKTEFNTGKYVELGSWDVDKERPIRNPDLTGFLDVMAGDIDRTHSRLIKENGETSSKELKDHLLGLNTDSPTVLEYFEQHNSYIKKLPDEYSLATVKKYKTVTTHLKNYLKSINKEYLKIHAFSTPHAHDLEAYLRTDSKLDINCKIRSK